MKLTKTSILIKFFFFDGCRKSTVQKLDTTQQLQGIPQPPQMFPHEAKDPTDT